MLTFFLISYTFHCTWVGQTLSWQQNIYTSFTSHPSFLLSLPPSLSLPPHPPSPNVQVTSEAYSSPSIVLAANQHDGSRIIFDDFREAYYWLRQNTPEDAKVMSWWDYGYQITAMANRTILVDNNTWNNTHISRVGQVSEAADLVSVAYSCIALFPGHMGAAWE